MKEYKNSYTTDITFGTENSTKKIKKKHLKLKEQTKFR